MTLSCVATSDTHGMYRDIEIPPADVFIHAGDITRYGKLSELNDFNDWLGELPHKYKIIIAGNHDWCFENDGKRARAKITNAIYLEDESITIEGVKFYGSPWQPWFLSWAFNLARGLTIKKKWDLIEADTDVLVTHGPPHMILDRVIRGDEHVGCEELAKAIHRIKPKYHVFGHIHESYGTLQGEDTHFINASLNNFRYYPVNPPILFKI